MEQNYLENNLNQQNRTDKLINELKIYKTVNHSLHSKIYKLESKEHSSISSINSLEKRLENANNKIEFLEKEKKCLIKKYTNKIDLLEKEIRRNSIFNKKIIGTHKSKNESMMIREMDSLRSVNSTLLSFVKILGDKIGFDSEIAKCLCEVAVGVEDNILQLFIQDIEVKYKKE